MAPQPNAPEKPELRLALGMRGGVSLAVWIGGACAEIDALRRAAEEPHGFWAKVLQQSPYSKVVVDVMAGASAGGLNGVLFAAAIRHGYRMGQLLPIWCDVAALKTLTRAKPPWISVFDGDLNFLDVIQRELDRLICVSGTGDDEAYVDLQLSATLVEPLDQAATSPTDERLRRRRSTARFHFRQDVRAAVPKRDLDPEHIPKLAVAARGTASFPVAFEAAAVRSSRPERFGAPPPAPDGPNRLVDCRGVFSESNGAPRPAGEPFHQDDFVVADGGIVDNIPLGKALSAIRDAPASGPTRRVLVYLHPTGPSGIAGKPSSAGPDGRDAAYVPLRRGPQAVVSGMVASKVQGESIDVDLEQFEDHNRTIRLARLYRQVALNELPPHGAALASDKRRLSAYRLQRGGADSETLRRLLADPLAVLGEDPFPLAPALPETGPGQDPLRLRAVLRIVPDDRWRAPLAQWTSATREALAESLTRAFTARIPEDVGQALLLVGLGGLQRSTRLLIEWVRALEQARTPDRPTLGDTKAALYGVSSLLQTLERTRRLGWVTRGGGVPEDAGSVPEWVDTSLTFVDGLLCVPADIADGVCSEKPAGTIARYVELANERLQVAVDGGTTPSEGVDLRPKVLERLHAIMGPVFALPAAASDLRHAELIDRVLLPAAGSPDLGELGGRLAALEVLLIQEHLLGSPGGSQINFVRMSAAAETIDSGRFTQLHEYSTVLDPAFTADGDHLVPDVKLAGNELGSFSAFLDQRWRVNDWVWGRMDAVPTLVDLLLGLDRPVDKRVDPQHVAAAVGLTSPPPTLAEVRRELVRMRQDEIRTRQIRADAAGTGVVIPEEPAEWEMGLEDLSHRGSTAIAEAVEGAAAVAGLVTGHALPPTAPRVSAQLSALARWGAQRLAKPTGRLPDLPGITDATSPPPDRGGVPGHVVGAAALIFGILVAAVVWAAFENPVALVIGLVAATVLTLGPAGFALWLATRPDPARRRERGSVDDR